MNNNKIKKIGIVGLSFHKLTGNPLETMLSNPVRSWALFSLLGAYNFETYLYVGNAEIELPIMEKYGERFIRDSREFVEKANTKFFDGLIIVGTKLHKTLIEHPWIKEIHKSKIFCAICADTYHELGGGRPLNFPPDITDQLVGMAFVSPYQKRLWDRRNSQIPSIVMTTGQIQKPENANESDGSVVFVGIFHNAEKLRDVAVMARIDRERTYHIISGVIGKANQLVNFHKLPPEKRQDNFRKLVLEQIDFDYPQNLLYHFLPPGSEAEILGRATVAIDFAWDWSLGIDASKVANYLTWGLCPVVENLQPSYRFLQRFNSGGIIPYGSSPAKWVEQIQKLAKTPLAIKNDLRKSAGSFFSWNNVAYEVGSFLRDHFDWAE